MFTAEKTFSSHARIQEGLYFEINEFRAVYDKIGACRTRLDSERSQKVLIRLSQLVCGGPRKFLRLPQVATNQKV